MFRQHLDGNIPAESCISRPVDLPHPARADRRDDLVRAEPRTRCQWQLGEVYFQGRTGAKMSPCGPKETKPQMSLKRGSSASSMPGRGSRQDQREPSRRVSLALTVGYNISPTFANRRGRNFTEARPKVAGSRAFLRIGVRVGWRNQAPLEDRVKAPENEPAPKVKGATTKRIVLATPT